MEDIMTSVLPDAVVLLHSFHVEAGFSKTHTNNFLQMSMKVKIQPSSCQEIIFV